MEFSLMEAAASGMDAERAVLDVSARNLAAAQAAGPRGDFVRQAARLVAEGGDGETTRVRFAGTVSERSRGGDVLMEMVAVMNASRAYEANAAIFETGKHLVQRTVEMGRA